MTTVMIVTKKYDQWNSYIAKYHRGRIQRNQLKAGQFTIGETTLRDWVYYGGVFIRNSKLGFSKKQRIPFKTWLKRGGLGLLVIDRSDDPDNLDWVKAKWTIRFNGE